MSTVETRVEARASHAPVDRSPRLATLAAVLLGLVAIGSSLPVAAGDDAPLWSGPPTSHAAATKAAVLVLLAVLLWCAVLPGIASYVVQAVAGVLVLAAVATGPDVGSGGALLGLSGLLAAAAGLVALASWRAARLDL